MQTILSLDLGTTAVKVALFDTTGAVLAKSSHEYVLETPTTLAVELETETYWRAFKAGVAEVLALSGADPADIVVLGISAQGETLILVDNKGAPLRKAIVWMDNRAQDEAAELAREFDRRLTYQTTGQVSIVPTWPAAKILWVRRHEPEVFAKTARFLLIEDWFIQRLTGQCVAEGSLLCSTVYWDITKKTWWKDMLKRLGVDEGQLPAIRESGQAVGALLPAVARELGLPETMTVCTGALDQAAGAVGVGNIAPGVFSENTGAALAICATVAGPVFDPRMQMPCHYHAMADTYMAHTFTTGGMVLKWFRDHFCTEEMQVGRLAGMDPYDILGREASRVAAGCDGLVMLPHLQGAMAPEDNPKAKGVFYGITLRHGRGHFARSILESIAYIVRRNIDILEGMGIAVNEIRCLGGGARSDVWNQIKADITGRPVQTLENEEAACLGAAMVAGVGTGIFESLESAVANMVRPRQRFEPDLANAAAYGEGYARYKKLYASLVDMFADDRG